MTLTFKKLASDFSLIRLVGKKPVEKGWQRYCQEKRNFEEIGFKDGDNAGIACGPASGILVVDVDNSARFEKACQENSWSLPRTRAHQTGAGGFHYLYIYPDGENYGNKSFKNLGFDIRGIGGQIVAPGSTHPNTGKLYTISDPSPIAAPPEWLLSLFETNHSAESTQKPAEIDVEELDVRSKTKKLILEGVPVGQRSEKMMTVLDALCGSAGLSDDEIIEIFEHYPIGDKYREKGENRQKWLQSQIKKARVYVGTSKPKIDADCQNLPKITKRAWRALRGYNKPARIFWHASGMVRMGSRPDGTQAIEVLTKDSLRGELARSAEWIKKSKDGAIRTYPPSFVCMDMLVHPNPPLAHLERIIFHPLFDCRGNLHDAAGYSKHTKCYFAKPPGLKIPPVASRPTRADVNRAKDLINDLLSDFPFVGEAEKAHSIGLLLLPFIRPLIKGPTPLHLIEAPTPGTGKTLLARCLTLPSTGGDLQVLTEGRDEDEWRKRITSALRKQCDFLLIDNLQKRLDSPALASALTSTVWTDRILGQSNIVSIPISCGWMATGNNPTISPEMIRRTVRIRLDAQTEMPWLRPNNSWKHPNLEKWVQEYRGDLIRAALTLVQFWISIGCPEEMNTKSLGMFEQWSAKVGSILKVSNISGFLENLPDLYETTDSDESALKRLTSLWWEIHGSSPVGVSELFTIVRDFEIPLEFGGGESERGQKISFGKYLQRLRSRNIAGFKILRGKTKNNSQTWSLSPCSTPTITSGLYSDSTESEIITEREIVETSLKHPCKN